ncbi:hypothetical protein BH23ACT4_BH23ACT4_00310 [soil metagenome]
MAEIALGGLHVEVKRTRPGLCLHEQTLTTITCGLQRIVCESCGHVGVRYIRPISGPIDRRRFARQADLLHEASLNHEGSREEVRVERREEVRVVRREEEVGGFSYSAVGVFSSKELVPIRNRA